MGLADIHLHTIYSYDGTASVPSVLGRAHQNGLDVIAITDHDEVRGSLKALDLASKYEIEIIPGLEVTTLDGDLLALFVTEKIQRSLSLVETVLKVGELGGVCVAPHPMAGGLGMKSLNAVTILKALRDPDVARVLIGIETYNATALDRMCNHYAQALAGYVGIAQTGSSDAHVIDAIGLGATVFPGRTAQDLLQALRDGMTQPRRGREWNSARILGSWAANYLGSSLTRFSMVTG